MQEIAVSNVTAWDVNLFTDLNNDPQLFATSHTYKISWNGVQYNDLSVGRLLLLIGIARAEAAEAVLQNEMEMLARQTALLESSCQAMNKMVSSPSAFLPPVSVTVFLITIVTSAPDSIVMAGVLSGAVIVTLSNVI